MVNTVQRLGTLRFVLKGMLWISNGGGGGSGKCIVPQRPKLCGGPFWKIKHQLGTISKSGLLLVRVGAVYAIMT